jgi:hypothetical protein
LNTISKKWRENSNEYEIKFICNSEFGSLSNYFEILNVSPREYGDFDTDELSFFPSTLTITISDYLNNNFFLLKRIMESYNSTFPFNFKSICYTEYRINNVLKHQGIIADVNYTDASEEIEVTITDACEYFKKVNLDNAEFLDYMGRNGLPRKKLTTSKGYDLYFYGLDNAELFSLPGFDGQIVKTGMIMDWSFNLSAFLQLLFKTVNPDCRFEIDIDFRFSQNNTFDDTVSADQLWIYAVFSNIIGRYAVVPNVQDDQLPVFSEENWEIIAAGPYKKVYRYKEEQTLEDKNLISVVKNLCHNFFGRMAWNSFDSITLGKKFSVNPDNCILLTDDMILDESITKQTFIPGLKHVKIYDRFNKKDALRGTPGSGLSDDEKLEYDILFSSYVNEGSSGYSLYYNRDGHSRPAAYCKDPVSGYHGVFAEVIAQLEWWHRKDWRCKHTMTLWGTDWDFSKTYKYRDKGHAMVLLRPMKMSADDSSNLTNIEFIEITRD